MNNREGQSLRQNWETMTTLLDAIGKEGMDRLLEARHEALSNEIDVSVTVPTSILLLGEQVSFTITFRGLPE